MERFTNKILASAKALASRHAALQDGEEVTRRKRGSGDEVQNIQLAIFTDRSYIPSLLKTARDKAAKGVIFLKLCAVHPSLRSLFNYVRQRYPNEPIARIDQVLRNVIKVPSLTLDS